MSIQVSIAAFYYDRTPSQPKSRKDMETHSKIRDRVTEFRRIPASEILPNARNFRVHPKNQREAFRGLLGEIGFAGAELCYHSARNGGKLTLIDGAMRREELPDAELPCLITDLTDAEADLLLASFDASGAMATADAVKLTELLRDVHTGDNGIQAMLSALASSVSSQAIAEMANAGGDVAEETDESATDFKTFSVPVTADQELSIRSALRKARVKFSCESSGEALAKSLEEWANGEKS